MATATQIAAFIEQIAQCAQKAYEEIGKVLPSVCIGMACVESGYGTSGSVKHHSYFGQKVGTGKTATKYWDGDFFTSKTQEEYQIGTHVTIKAAFRAYKSMQQCVNNYYELLNTNLYQKVQAGADYRTQMAQIKACGYMTSSTEVNSVISIIEKYNLTKYDPRASGKPKARAPKNFNPYKVPTHTLKQGSVGNEVKWLQLELSNRGYHLDIDGIFGPVTSEMVKQYQKKQGLVVDGIVGARTRGELTAGR